MGPVHVRFGWTGWHRPNISSRGDSVAVVDGRVFNGEDLDWVGDEASLVLDLAERLGFVEAVRRLNGDFAIAFYDAPARRLWLARDRFGVKPLYYTQVGSHTGFASQPGALLTVPGVSHEVNRQFAALVAASHYRYFDNEPTRSPYVAVQQLPAAHVALIADGECRLLRYWTLESQPDFAAGEDELAEEYRALLVDAVARRRRRFSRPAFTLSGGMDSSSVLACAVHESGARQPAFSTLYDDSTYDETAEIRTMLDAAVDPWEPVRVGTPDVFGLVEELIAIHDEPVATATWLPHHLLCRTAAARGHDALFGGLGGDELNAGEYEHFVFFFADLKRAGDEVRLAHEMSRWAWHHDHPVFRKNGAVVSRAFTELVDLARPGVTRPDYARLRRYAHLLNPDYFDLGAFVPVMEAPFGSYLKNRTYQDITRETIPCCLRAEDRQTTASSLENVAPFFDHRLAEFMFRVPGTMQIRCGVTKQLLRRAMSGLLPEATRTRVKKTGWNAPAHVWFAGEGASPLRDLVDSRAFHERGIYNVVAVRALIDEHDRIVSSQVPAENHMMLLWQLVNLELWLRRVDSICTNRDE